MDRWLDWIPKSKVQFYYLRQPKFLPVNIVKLSARITLQFLRCNRNVGALVNWVAFQDSLLNFGEERIVMC